MVVQKQGLHLPLYGEVPKLLVGDGTQFYQERVCAYDLCLVGLNLKQL